MNISKETLTLIRNFASINGSLILTKGSKLRTISEAKNVVAEVDIIESFPQDFAIYDLNEFLSAVSIFGATVLDFKDKYVDISDGGRSKIKYFAAGEGVVKAPPSSIKFPSSDVEFSLDAGQLNVIFKTSSALKAPDLTITGDGKEITAMVHDKKNPSSNAYEMELGSCDQEFKAHLKIENLKMLPGEYSVEISKKKISRFKNKEIDLTYYIAIESDSEF